MSTLAPNLKVIQPEEVERRYGVTPDSSLSERVAAGAAWLDEHVPDWADRVSLPEFEMESRCDCVLGQVFATVEGDSHTRHAENDLGFDRVVDGWSLDVDGSQTHGEVLSRSASQALAFDAPPGHGLDEYDLMQMEWTEFIAARQTERNAHDA